ncbi:hypothetical protein LIA77_11335 [Sarocladium implicatum]|nr:hypothetical protein LIA77_11335 [Sarocladium implicatum]
MQCTRTSALPHPSSYCKSEESKHSRWCRLPLRDDVLDGVTAPPAPLPPVATHILALGAHNPRLRSDGKNGENQLLQGGSLLWSLPSILCFVYLVAYARSHMSPGCADGRCASEKIAPLRL